MVANNTEKEKNPTAKVNAAAPTEETRKWKVQHRWDTAENWRTLNPLLRAGEKGIVSDSPANKREYRVGDGANRWNGLPACFDWDGEKFNSKMGNLRKPFVSFTADDGYKEDITILEPIFKKHGIPCCIAMVGPAENSENFLNNISERLLLQNEHNWEFLCHSDSPIPFNQQSLADAEISMIKSKDKLERLGFKISDLVYPSGAANRDIKNIARRHFRSAYLFNADKRYCVNDGILDSFSIHRVPFGSFTKDGQNSLEYYKSCIDQCLAKNGWLIFCIHSGNRDFDATQQQYLEDTILYCEEKGVSIGNISEGYSIFGNILESGNCQNSDGPESTEEDMLKFSVSFDGNTTLPIFRCKPQSITNDTIIEKFPKNKISVAEIANYYANFPTGSGGILTTYNFENWKFQLWFPNSENTIYRRLYATSKWGEWAFLTNVPENDISIAKEGSIKRTDYFMLKIHINHHIFVKNIFIDSLRKEATIISRRISVGSLKEKIKVATSDTGTGIFMQYDGTYLKITNDGDLDIGLSYIIAYVQ